MERRRFLGASTAALLAGCGDTQTDSTQGENNSENETEPMDEQSQQVDGDAEIVISNSQWIEDESAVQFQIQNQGTTPSGRVDITLSWFDESGNYIGSDTASIGSLVDGRSWLGAIRPSTRFETNSYEASTQYNVGRRSSSTNTELLEYEVDEAEQAIVGKVKNLTEEYASIQGEASTYNGGWISHTGFVSDSDVPPGATWRFYLPLTTVEYGVEKIGDDVDIRFLSSN